MATIDLMGFMQWRSFVCISSSMKEIQLFISSSRQSLGNVAVTQMHRSDYGFVNATNMDAACTAD